MQLGTETQQAHQQVIQEILMSIQVPQAAVAQELPEALEQFI
jgi:hypothetical protein